MSPLKPQTSKQEFNIDVPFLLKDLSCMKINRPVQISQVLQAYHLFQHRLIFLDL